MVPLNLLRGKTSADYYRTGSWSKKAIAEAKRYCDVNIVSDTEADGKFTSVPDEGSVSFNADAAYVHYTPNETIEGVEFSYVPDTGDVPLVADMSSTILSRSIDVSKFAVIYAGAQKNPATYGWYLAGLVFAWLKDKGGLSGMAEINKRKAEKLYAAIDTSDFYANPVNKNCRSWMNVPFTLPNADLDADFLAGAKEAGLVTLKGHRSVGGMRASIYNAMPEEGVDTLISFMADFEKQHG
jgi:phosphoserine aminotransferase